MRVGDHSAKSAVENQVMTKLSILYVNATDVRGYQWPSIRVQLRIYAASLLATYFGCVTDVQIKVLRNFRGCMNRMINSFFLKINSRRQTCSFMVGVIKYRIDQ
jgi:hypothetical protein